MTLDSQCFVSQGQSSCVQSTQVSTGSHNDTNTSAASWYDDKKPSTTVSTCGRRPASHNSVTGRISRLWRGPRSPSPRCGTATHAILAACHVGRRDASHRCLALASLRYIVVACGGDPGSPPTLGVGSVHGHRASYVGTFDFGSEDAVVGG